MFYYITNVYNLVSATSVGFLVVGSFFTIFFFMLYKKILNKKEILIMIIILGLVLRFTYGCVNGIHDFQHDLGLAYEKGHYGYAVYIFRTLKLPSSNELQLYQPPLNAFLQALFMRVNSLFIPIFLSNIVLRFLLLLGNLFNIFPSIYIETYSMLSKISVFCLNL